MAEELDIRSLSVTDAAKLLKVQAKTIRAHIRRGLPLVDGRIDLIVYGAWVNMKMTANTGSPVLAQGETNPRSVYENSCRGC